MTSRTRLLSSAARLAAAGLVLYAPSALAQAAPAPAPTAPAATASTAPVAAPAAPAVSPDAVAATETPPAPEPAAAPAPEPVVAPVPEPAPAPAAAAGPPPATELALAPVVGVDDKGFVLRSHDSAYSLKLKGVVQVDGRKYVDDPVLREGDGFLLRKIRPVFDITVLKFADLRFTVDFAGSAVSVIDAYVDVKPTSWLKIRAGKVNQPVGLERSQGDPELAFMERSLSANLSPSRDVGVLAIADFLGGGIHAVAGVVDGAPDGTMIDVDSNQGKDVTGRIWVRPLRLAGVEADFGELGIGIAGSIGEHEGAAAAGRSGLAPLRSSGQTPFFQFAAPEMDAANIVYADGNHSRLNPQLFYFNRGFGLLAEYSRNWQRVTRGATSERLGHQGFHATVNYVIGGKAALSGTAVDNGYNPAKGHYGAFELAAQYGQIRLDEDTFPTFSDPNRWARLAHGFGGAASWYLSRNLRLSFNYDHTTLRRAEAATADLPRTAEKVVLARTQVLF